MSATDEILFEHQGGLGLITLNRPKALNTLSLAMYRRFAPQLVAWAADPSIFAVVVQGAGDRAFCAGGDVRAIYDARASTTGPDDYKADFFREEYQLIRHVHRFPKPYLALIDGITMGGGAGIAVNGAYRIATERTLFAMPEVHLGLFPDVGASRFLNLCPGRAGVFLALTGKRIGAADAIYCGFATHYVPHTALAGVIAALGRLNWRSDGAHQQIDEVLGDVTAAPGAPSLQPLQPALDRCFAGASVAEMILALSRETAEWARDALTAIARASPTSLKITLRQLLLGVGMTVEAALQLEYRMTQHCMAQHDFFEGIRALLVDKDGTPRWQPAALAEVSAAMVDSYFIGLGERELRFD